MQNIFGIIAIFTPKFGFLDIETPCGIQTLTMNGCVHSEQLMETDQLTILGRQLTENTKFEELHESIVAIIQVYIT